VMRSLTLNNPSSDGSADTSRGGGRRVPPFCSGEGRWRREDFLSREGATKLGEIARAAWAKCDKDVPFIIVKLGTNSKGHETFAPRFPTLFNGLPVA